jgi:ubiquinone/menaquinone biosynthesis C-methylase UbiE
VSTNISPELLFAERQRVRAAYRRRAAVAELYAPWQPAEEFMRAGRRRRAIGLLTRAGAFPLAGDAALEIGCGARGWLPDLLSWGLESADLHGVDLDQERIAKARAAFPGADLRVGDAAALPWPDDAFRLVVASTVFSSILDREVRRAIAAEAARVLAPGGVLAVVDLARHDDEAFRERLGQASLGFEPDALAALLAGAGLAVSRVAPLPAEPGARGPALLLARAEKARARRRPTA